jgi:type II secretory pathway pseudopilin PulG
MGRHAGPAFSMVEVVLAVAIIGVAMVAIFGLMPVGINASRQVSDETLVSGLAANMLHWRRVTPFENPTWMPPGAPALTNLPRPIVVYAYFDANGRLPFDSSGNALTNWAGPYIRCTYKVQDHPRYSNSVDIAQVLITMEWPCVNTGTITPAPSLAGANVVQQRYFVGHYVRSTWP